MKILFDQLAKNLTEKTAPFYLLSGDEPLLLQEALTCIEQYAQQQGFTEKQRLDATETENAAQLQWACFNRSLLAEKTLIIATFTATRPDQHPWHTIFTRFAAHPSADKLLVILLGKLTPQQLNAAWLQKLSAQGAWLHIPTLPIKHFPHVLQQRLTAQGFSITPQALQLLCDYVEGNLLAAQQCITKLQLLYSAGQTLQETEILSVIAPSNRYTVFDLINAITAKQLNKMPRILTTLAADGTEPAIILWALARECRRQQQTAWIKALFHIDQIIKGLAPNEINIWVALERVSFMMAGRALR